MTCPVCNSAINDGSKKCPQCQLDIDLLRQVFQTSRHLYNEALQKANERDISTAISLLRKSLGFDKKFIEGRNLLGLLYYRMGELGEAIKHWKLSYQLYDDDKNNDAFRYLKLLFNKDQKRKFQQYKSTIEMYNEALIHLNQKSDDLAIIKLKKAVHINPSFVKANNLLAYCYLKANQTSRALNYINNVLAIDSRNPIAVYYKEYVLSKEEVEEEDKVVETMTQTEENQFSKAVVFSSRKKPRGFAHLSQIVIFVLGIAIGVASMLFLFIPDKVSKLNDEMAKLETSHKSALEDKARKITEQEEKIDKLATKVAELEAQLDRAKLTGSQIKSVDRLLTGVQFYNNKQINECANELLAINEAELTVKGKELYQFLKNATFSKASYNAFIEADRHYRNSKFEDSIKSFQKALELSIEEWFTEECYYRIARAYKDLGQNDKAKQAFEIYFGKYTAKTGKFYNYAAGHYDSLK